MGLAAVILPSFLTEKRESRRTIIFISQKTPKRVFVDYSSFFAKYTFLALNHRESQATPTTQANKLAGEYANKQPGK